MIAKEVAALVLASCLCLGSFEALSRDDVYDRALNDPEFYHLVDEAGNPVSQLSD